MAVATIGRDRLSLSVEAALEQGDTAALEIHCAKLIKTIHGTGQHESAKSEHPPVCFSRRLHKKLDTDRPSPSKIAPR